MMSWSPTLHLDFSNLDHQAPVHHYTTNVAVVTNAGFHREFQRREANLAWFGNFRSSALYFCTAFQFSNLFCIVNIFTVPCTVFEMNTTG